MGYAAALTAHYKALNEPEETLARTIESVMPSCSSLWDLLTELLQNTVDGIFERKRKQPSFTTGKIELNAPDGTVLVDDNGTGIPAGKYVDMILPGGSLKQGGTAYGRKGVGFTYFAHVAEKVEVETHCDDGSREHWQFSDGFAWSNDRANKSPIVATGLPPSLRQFANANTGTAVKLTLAEGRYEVNRANTTVLDKFFEWANNEKLLTFVLRTKTAVSQTFSLFGKAPPVGIDISVTLQGVDGMEPARLPLPAEFVRVHPRQQGDDR